MIYTLTLNPAIDYIMYVDDLNIGKTNRSQSEKMLPGGKGINVSRILNQFNLENQALGYVGGKNGEFIEKWLESEGSKHDFIKTSEESRINVKIKGDKETEINGVGPIISMDQSLALLDKIAQLAPNDILVLSGSKAKGLAEDFYQQVIQVCVDKNIQFVIDTNSAELLAALSSKPVLVKPNLDELSDLFSTSISTIEEVKHYGHKLLEAGARNVIVSLGGDGAIFINDEQTITAQAPKGHVVNTVGSGDSMIGGFLAGLAQQLPTKEVFSLAVQCGSATAFNEDLAKLSDIQALNGLVALEVERNT